MKERWGGATEVKTKDSLFRALFICLLKGAYLFKSVLSLALPRFPVEGMHEK